MYDVKSVSQPDTMPLFAKQLLILNYRNRVRWVVLGLSEDGACTDLFENLSVNSFKGDLSNATTFNPPLFSLVNIFNITEEHTEWAYDPDSAKLSRQEDTALLKRPSYRKLQKFNF